MTMSKPTGHCPVQSYGEHEGWLLYFRAREGWTLHAWAPGKWDPRADVGDIPATHYFSPDIEVDERDEDDTTPKWDSVVHEESYPGWWSHQYAQAMLDWAFERFVTRARNWRGAL